MDFINLSHFKQGDDFNNAFKEVESEKKRANVFSEALRKQAAVLKNDSEKLEKIANLIDLLPEDQQKKVKILGESNNIEIKGPTAFMKVLKSQKLI